MNNFTDKQKAEIFVRDRATCCYFCKSLWVLDYGDSSIWDYDWVDHIIPKSRGGEATLDNGLCASSTANYYKRNSTDWVPFLKNGTPTKEYYNYFKVIPTILKCNLNRFSNLHYTDWYLNPN